MDIDKLRESQARFENRKDEIIEEREPVHKIRRKFIEYFTPNRILNLDIHEYAAGFGKPVKGHNFCYGLERDLDGLGRILGAPAPRFGIYFSKDNNKLMISKKWGNSLETAFPKIKKSIVDLIAAGKNKDLESIAKCQLSEMFKGKILSSYYPETFVNVFSEDHLNYFLIQLNLDNAELLKRNPIYKKMELVRFKDEDDVMKNWSIDQFSNFLYKFYPEKPPKDNSALNNDSLAEYKPYIFPAFPIPSFITLEIIELNLKDPIGKLPPSSNPNYEHLMRRNKELGNRGEHIVLEMERSNLIKLGFPELARKVNKAKFDSDGYDILSFNSDGSKKHIEVKATTHKVGETNFFLSTNELNKSEKLENYQVYVVYEILTENPKVWNVGNPFTPKNLFISMTPVSYKVQINTKLK